VRPRRHDEPGQAGEQRPASRIARRYTAGETIDDAVATARASMARGHLVSIEYAGESVRDARVADAGTEVFLALAARLRAEELGATVSFDLSHVGSVVDRDLALRNARRMAAATAPLGTALMISAEGPDRTDLTLDLSSTRCCSGSAPTSTTGCTATATAPANTWSSVASGGCTC
jgi:proline dehydrogenase